MNRSIRRRLLILLLSGFLVGWLVVTLLIWWHTRSEVNRVFDAQLAQVGRLLAVTTLHETLEHDLHGFEALLRRQEYEYPAVLQVWSQDGRLLISGPSAPTVAFSDPLSEGFSEAVLGDETWRVLTLQVKATGHRVVVAQARSVRDHLIGQFMFHSLHPLLLAIPLLGVLWLGVERELKPLRQVARQIARRNPRHLEPLAHTRIPEEIVPLVDAVNGLFQRLTAVMHGYRRFTGDAAHELRTPLAGAITQLHAALHAPGEELCRERLCKVLNGLQQLSHLVDQLLTLARTEPEHARQGFVEVELTELAAEVVSELTPRALALGVEVGLRSDQPVRVRGNAQLLISLLSNLLDNSLRATPQGGEVSVVLAQSPEGPWLSVEDNGTGIPQDQKAQVLERFHRLDGTPGPGSGLGLSIVQAVAEIHGARLELQDAEPGPGLRVRICFPPGSQT